MTDVASVAHKSLEQWKCLAITWERISYMSLSAGAGVGDDALDDDDDNDEIDTR